jgi:hypothetical protein
VPDLAPAPLCGDDKVQGPKAHVHARDPADAVASHPKPDESDKCAKAPTWCANCQCFELSTSKFVFYVWPGW